MIFTRTTGGALLLALTISLVTFGCGSSGPLNPDGGATAGSAGEGGAGASGASGSSGAAGKSGSGNAGTHGGGSGGGGSGAGGGSAGQGGLCACAEIFAPVCGVDGKTYSNQCTAVCEGVTVAHEGACVAPMDASTDAPLGYCDQESDCVSRLQGCSCTSTCVAATDPVPSPPTAVCNIACPLIATLCTCINHQCGSHAIGAPVAP